MKNKKKRSIWDMVDEDTKKKSEDFIKRLKAGKIRNIHRTIFSGHKGAGD